MVRFYIRFYAKTAPKLTEPIYYILIYNKRKGDNLVAWSHVPKGYDPLDRILNK